MIKSILKYLALNRKRCGNLYIRWCKPGFEEFNEFLIKHSGVHSIGQNTEINLDVRITDPSYVRIGSNCTLSSCTLIGHDGVIRVLNNAYGKKLDSVGKIDIKDNCFIGMGVIIMPNVTIGPNSIVAAGAVVTKDVPPGVVVGGTPAKVIGTTLDLVDKLEAKTNTLPWNHLIQKRIGAYDSDMEPELEIMRVKYFYK